MNAKLRLQLLQSPSRTQRRRNFAAQGFTLVELMIVVAVVGILSALAIPNFLRARDTAAIGAAMGEMVGIAKECATSAASDIGIGTTAAVNPAITPGTKNGDCTDGGTFALDTANFDPALQAKAFPAGIRCLNKTSAATDKVATITVTAAGASSCAFT